MAVAQETILDFDHTVGTEDRFAIRKFINQLTRIINGGGKRELAVIIDHRATAQGFLEFPIQQQQILEMFYKKFYGRRNNYMALPKLKLTSSNFLFHLNGLYEEYQEGILSAAGTIDLSLIKDEEEYRVVSLIFYPRMRTADNYAE